MVGVVVRPLSVNPVVGGYPTSVLGLGVGSSMQAEDGAGMYSHSTSAFTLDTLDIEALYLFAVGGAHFPNESASALLRRRASSSSGTAPE
jgi:hypothetical protein